MGFKGSRAAPTTFYNPATKVRLVVHGDDFTLVREDAWLVQEVARCEGQRHHGEWHGGRQRGGDLRKTLKFTEMGLEYTADGKHRGTILEGLGLEPESKSLGGPALAADKMDEAGGEDELPKEGVPIFRSVAARSNYLGMDCPDIRYGVKELCASMSRPRPKCRGGS